MRRKTKAYLALAVGGLAVLAAAVTLALGNAFLTKAFHSIQGVSDRLYERWRA